MNSDLNVKLVFWSTLTNFSVKDQVMNILSFVSLNILQAVTNIQISSAIVAQK